MADPWAQFPDAPNISAPPTRGNDPWAAFPDHPDPDQFGLVAGDDGRSAELDAPANPPPTPDPVAQAADARVAEEAKAHPTIRAVDDIVRNLARGTPVGSWMDELSAGANAGLDKVSGGLLGEPYDTGVAYQRARDRASDTNATKVGELPVIGDVTTAGLEKLAGGIAAFPAAPFAKIVKGASALPTMANAAINSAGYGGLYGAGMGDTPQDRLENAGEGATLGGLLGPIGVGAARVGGNVLSAARGVLKPLPATLKGLSRRAVDYVSKDFDADLWAHGSVSYAQQAADLGPHSMLADMGSAMREHLGGLATKPQVNAPIVRAIEGRASGAEQRLDSAIDQAAGPPVNVPQMIEQMTTAKKAAAAPLYNRFYNTTIKPTDELVSILHAVPQKAYQAAYNMMQGERLDPNAIGNSGRMVDLIKRGLNKIVGDHTDKLTGQVDDEGRVYSKLAKQLTDETDRILSPNDPTKSVWAIARKTAGEHLRLKAAFDEGQKALDKNLSADQMAYDMRKMSPEERQMYRTGARQKIRAVAENASTASGANPDTAERKMLSTRNAEKKIGFIASSPSSGRALTRTVKQETTFANTEREVLRNSKSASRIEQGKRYPLDQTDSHAPISVEQIAFGGVRKVIDTLVGGALTEARVKAASDAAKMLIAQGADRDAIAKGLRGYLKGQNVTMRQRVAITRVINQVLHGSRGALIDGQAKKRASR